MKREQKIDGEFIELHEITLADAELIYAWRTSDSGRFMNQPDGYSLGMQSRWMMTRPDSEINFLIYSKKLEKKVGMIAIVGISEQDQNAEVGRLLLAPEFLKSSNPYGLEALKICFDLIINKWGFNKIYGNVLSANQPMLKMQKFLGMIEEGLLREQKTIHEKKYDLHLVAIFSEGLNKSYLPKISMLLKSFK